MENAELIEKFKKMQLDYQKKRNRMDAWKSDFQRLEIEIKDLMESFENLYQGSQLTEDFSMEIKEKLENRREGIRLSVKSASRLLRKLDPEKPLSDVEHEFITSEEFAHQIQAKRAHDLTIEEEEQNDLPSEEDAKEGVENEFPSEEDFKDERDNGDHSAQDQSQETAQDEDEMVLHSDEKPIGQEEIVEDQEQPKVKDEEKTETETVSKGERNDLAHLHEVLLIDEEILKELEEYLETAENRFLKFMEKGVAPVLDGLYSGKNFAKDLIDELEKNEKEELDKTKQWLTIYDVLMNKIEQFFEQFSIKLYIPKSGSLFDENNQEPIGVVDDEQFHDEQIKEVVRFGLIYEKEIYNQPSFLFRPAQVIVVKNKNQKEIVDSGEGNEQ